MAHNTRIINCKKQELNKRGIRDFSEWIQNSSVLYIGRDMTRYIPNTIGSKWGNPFNVNKYGRDKCLELYENHIRTTPELWNSVDELKNYTELGCWCKPEPCHGDILLKLIDEKLKSK